MVIETMLKLRETMEREKVKIDNDARKKLCEHYISGCTKAFDKIYFDRVCSGNFERCEFYSQGGCR